MIDLNPAYAKGLAEDPGWIDMSWNIASGNSYVLNTVVDRAYISEDKGFAALVELVKSGRILELMEEDQEGN